jgi:hypothetical protein
VRDRSGAAPACNFGGEVVADGIRRDLTHAGALEKAQRPVFFAIHLDLDVSFRKVAAT